jgi:hypothetical protein
VSDCVFSFLVKETHSDDMWMDVSCGFHMNGM